MLTIYIIKYQNTHKIKSTSVDISHISDLLLAYKKNCVARKFVGIKKEGTCYYKTNIISAEHPLLLYI